MIPLTLEQLVFTFRVVQLGAGLLLLPDKTDPVRQAIETLLHHPRYKTAANVFADRYSNYSPQEKIEQIVESIDQLTQNPRAAKTNQ